MGGNHNTASVVKVMLSTPVRRTSRRKLCEHPSNASFTSDEVNQGYAQVSPQAPHGPFPSPGSATRAGVPSSLLKIRSERQSVFANFHSAKDKTGGAGAASQSQGEPDSGNDAGEPSCQTPRKSLPMKRNADTPATALTPCAPEKRRRMCKKPFSPISPLTLPSLTQPAIWTYGISKISLL